MDSDKADELKHQLDEAEQKWEQARQVYRADYSEWSMDYETEVRLGHDRPENWPPPAEEPLIEAASEVKRLRDLLGISDSLPDPAHPAHPRDYVHTVPLYQGAYSTLDHALGQAVSHLDEGLIPQITDKLEGRVLKGQEDILDAWEQKQLRDYSQPHRPLTNKEAVAMFDAIDEVRATRLGPNKTEIGPQPAPSGGQVAGTRSSAKVRD
jgi:hypothetical protein